MTQPHNSQQSQMTDGQGALRGCPSFETLCLYFDHELTPAEIETITAHVDQCEACTATLRDFRIVRQALVATSPAMSQRPFRLTEADVEGERPAVRLLEPVTPVAPVTTARRRSMLTIPFAPALAAIAAVLLAAVVFGDLITRDDGTNGGVFILPNGTQVPIESEDHEPNVETKVVDPDNGSGRAKREDFWNWWRVGEILLLAILAGLLATILLQRRARGE